MKEWNWVINHVYLRYLPHSPYQGLQYRSIVISIYRIGLAQCWPKLSCLVGTCDFGPKLIFLVHWLIQWYQPGTGDTGGEIQQCWIFMEVNKQDYLLWMSNFSMLNIIPFKTDEEQHIMHKIMLNVSVFSLLLLFLIFWLTKIGIWKWETPFPKCWNSHYLYLLGLSGTAYEIDITKLNS